MVSSLGPRDSQNLKWFAEALRNSCLEPDIYFMFVCLLSCGRRSQDSKPLSCETESSDWPFCKYIALLQYGLRNLRFKPNICWHLLSHFLTKKSIKLCPRFKLLLFIEFLSTSILPFTLWLVLVLLEFKRQEKRLVKLGLCCIFLVEEGNFSKCAGKRLTSQPCYILSCKIASRPMRARVRS